MQEEEKSQTQERVLPVPLDVVQVPLSPVTSPVVAQNQQRIAFPKHPSPADTWWKKNLNPFY